MLHTLHTCTKDSSKVTVDYRLKGWSSVQSLSCVRLFATPWIAACQASLSITNSRSSLRLMPIESVMPSSHLILGRPLLLLPPIPPSIRVFSNESTLHMRWRKYWSFNFSIIPSREHPHSFSPLHFSSHTSHLELLVSYLSYVKVYRYSLKCKVILRKQHGYSELKSRLILSMIRPYNGPVSGSP